jgi:hypothetical protein
MKAITTDAIRELANELDRYVIGLPVRAYVSPLIFDTLRREYSTPTKVAPDRFNGLPFEPLHQLQGMEWFSVDSRGNMLRFSGSPSRLKAIAQGMKARSFQLIEGGRS